MGKRGRKRHPFQVAFTTLSAQLTDAERLALLTISKTDDLTALRRDKYSRGGGAPPSVHKTLHRATIVAAVGAWEAFNEELATVACDLDPTWPDRKDWFVISGSRGAFQTPNSRKVRSTYWSLFHYDPIADWAITVRTNAVELGTGKSYWRGPRVTHVGDDAADFLDGVVNIRHDFAHQDSKLTRTSKGAKPARPLAGLAEQGRTGKWNVHLVHALNALSCVLQLAVLTADGLCQHLEIVRDVNWTSAMTRETWNTMLAGTPADDVITANWYLRSDVSR